MRLRTPKVQDHKCSLLQEWSSHGTKINWTLNSRNAGSHRILAVLTSLAGVGKPPRPSHGARMAHCPTSSPSQPGGGAFPRANMQPTVSRTVISTGKAHGAQRRARSLRLSIRIGRGEGSPWPTRVTDCLPEILGRNTDKDGRHFQPEGLGNPTARDVDSSSLRF